MKQSKKECLIQKASKASKTIDKTINIIDW